LLQALVLALVQGQALVQALVLGQVLALEAWHNRRLN